MSPKTLSHERRQDLILRALSGENKAKLAKEYGVSRQHVYRLVDQAREKASVELEYWQQVAELVKGER